MPGSAAPPAGSAPGDRPEADPVTGRDDAEADGDAGAYDRAAWSWSEHLRHGGSREWGTGETAQPPSDHPPPGWAPAGAAQLELVRRLADRATAIGPWGPAFTSLADLVLGRSGPGRGLAQQALSWPPHCEPGSNSPVGPPPVHPADVPLTELVRLAAGTLTELVLTHPGPTAPMTTVRRRPFTRSPAFRLDGAPVSTAAVRQALGASGHGEGGRLPVVVLVAEPVDVALGQVWSARVQRGSAVRWHGLLDRCASRDLLPAAVDVGSLARTWATRVGPDRVQVVVAPGDAAQAAGMAAEAVGVDLSARSRGVLAALREVFVARAVDDLPAASVEAARRVNALLGVRAEGERRADAVRALVAALPGGRRGRPLTVPERHRAWALARGERMAEELLAGGYPVRGRLADLVPDVGGRLSRPRTAAVLEALLTACLHQGDIRADEHQQAGTEAT